MAFKYRVEDARLGRFFSVDPLMFMFPYNSNYAFSENRVIDSKELEGLERLYFADKKVTVDISSMTADQIQKMVEENGLNWDDDWYDPNAKDEYWVLSQAVNSSFDPTGTAIRKFSSEASKNSKTSIPYYTDIERSFTESLSAWDEVLNSHDGYREVPGIAFTVLGVIFSGGTLIAADGLGAIILAGVGLAASVDDLTRGPGENDKTILENLSRDLGGPEGAKLLQGAKLSLSVKDASKGLVNLTVLFADGRAIEGTYDLLNDIYSITSTVEETIEIDENIEK